MTTSQLTQTEVSIMAARMLRKIGWHSSNRDQIAVYVRMSPERKISQMLYWRHQAVVLLQARLRQEHPTASEKELSLLLQRNLALLQEDIPRVRPLADLGASTSVVE